MCACYVSVMCLRGVLEVGGLGVVPSGGIEELLSFQAPSAISFPVSLESDFSIKYAWGASARIQVLCF